MCCCCKWKIPRASRLQEAGIRQGCPSSPYGRADFLFCWQTVAEAQAVFPRQGNKLPESVFEG
eukprot:12913677-Prorocentrum_lima.AAC.1